MDILSYKQQRILVTGTDKVALSVCVCLLRAGHQVTLLLIAETEAVARINTYLADLKEQTGEQVDAANLSVVALIESPADYNMAIALTPEDADVKKALIQELESSLPADVLIAINAESITLSALQEHAKHPERVIGANWAEPAHTTYFLEVITNQISNQSMVRNFCKTAKALWHKDPYVLTNDKGVRTRLMYALIREAFYLVENEYCTVEDIDRSLRNDGGYYLSFAGNFRYMDLMGGFMYGVVMQDLNPELSRCTHIPEFCEEKLSNGSEGMANDKGFYAYEPGESAQWDKDFRKFSYQIENIISKYPFNYLNKENTVKSEVTS